MGRFVCTWEEHMRSYAMVGGTQVGVLLCAGRCTQIELLVKRAFS